MAKSIINVGSNRVIRHIFIYDTTSDVGEGLTGLDYHTPGLACAMIFSGSGYFNITLQTIHTIGTYQTPSGVHYVRFKEVSAANLPGYYELQFHDDLFGPGYAGKHICFQFRGAANMAPVNVELQVTAGLYADVIRWNGATVPEIADEYDVADAVCEEVLSGHTTTGTVGKALAQVLSAAGSYGSEDVTLYIKDSNGDVIPDVDVIIRSTNSATADPIASGTSDSFGVVQPHPQLDPGTYYIWRQKSNHNLTNPQTLTITAS